MPIVRDEVSESSVAFHEPSRCWIMTYLQDDRVPQLLVMYPTVFLSAVDYPMLYGFLHPLTMNSNTLGLVVSQWLQYDTRLFRAHLK